MNGNNMQSTAPYSITRNVSPMSGEEVPVDLWLTPIHAVPENVMAFIIRLMTDAQRVVVIGLRIHIYLPHGVVVEISPSSFFGVVNDVNIFVRFSNMIWHEHFKYTIVTYGFDARYILADDEKPPVSPQDFHRQGVGYETILLLAHYMEGARERLLNIQDTWDDAFYEDNDDVSDAIAHAVNPHEFPKIGDWIAVNRTDDDDDDDWEDDDNF